MTKDDANAHNVSLPDPVPDHGRVLTRHPVKKDSIRHAVLDTASSNQLDSRVRGNDNYI